MTSRRSLLRVESTPSKDVYVFFILRRRVQRCCTAVRGVKNKKCIHRRHKILCVHNKMYLSETVRNICGRPHRVAPTTLSQICTHCKNLSFRNSAHNQCEHKSKTVRQESMTSRRSLLRVESTPSKDVYVFFILRRRVQRCCTAVRGVKNKKCIHRRHKILCVHNKIYLSETVQNICGRPHRVAPTTLSQICTHCKNISSRNSAQNQCEHKSKTVRQGSSTSRRSLLRVESTLSKDVYVFFILRRRVQRCCTAVRGVKNKKYIHRRHKILCVHNKIYLSETVQNICGRPHRGVPTNPIAILR